MLRSVGAEFYSTHTSEADHNEPRFGQWIFDLLISWEIVYDTPQRLR